MKKLFFSILGISVLFMMPVLLGWTNCPPAPLSSNPQPVIIGGQSRCIVEADWVHLGLNESWSKKVQLKGGQSYWFSASKCARAYGVAGEVRDSEGKVIKSNSGSEVSFCFQAPKDGRYTVSYRVTGLRGSYTYAITNACLSESDCSS